MIESLENRWLFSTFLYYPAPDAVIQSAQAIVTAPPTTVLANATGNVPQGGTPSSAMLDVIESHEGYSLYVYPDPAGHPTIGAGLNIDTDNAGFASSVLASVGLDYNTIYASWQATEAVWVAAKHKLSALKDSSSLWAPFVASHPAVTTPVITDANVRDILSATVAQKLATAANFFGPQFWLLDRDPQIALTDLTYNVTSLTGAKGYPKLQKAIVGDSTNATDYDSASKQLSISKEKARTADDQALVRHGEIPTTFTIAPLTLKPGASKTLQVTTSGAFGKGIIVSHSKSKFVSSSNGIATVTNTGKVHARANGTAMMTESLTEAPGITATGTVTVGTPVKHKSQTFDIPFDGTPVPLIGVLPGDTVSIKAYISTDSDPNEDGEDENLFISSTGGFSVTDASFNVHVGYKFVATVPDEVVTAVITDADGDEVATVSATYSSVASSTFSLQQQSAFANTSSALDTSASGAGTVATTLLAGTSPFSQGASGAAWVSASLLSLASAEFSQLTADDSDTNYTAIARPKRTTNTISSHVKDFKGIKNAAPLVASINAVEANLQRSINLELAAYTTASRANGASDAGDDRWINRQLGVLKTYKRQIASLAKSQNLLSTREAAQLNKAGLGSTYVGSEDVQSFEQSIVDSGLPSQLVATLDKLGVDAATQSTIQQALFVQDTNAASGTYSSILTNATLIADLAQINQLLLKG